MKRIVRVILFPVAIGAVFTALGALLIAGVGFAVVDLYTEKLA